MREVTEATELRLRPPTEQDFSALSTLRRDLELQHLLLAYPSDTSPTDAEVAAWIKRRSSEKGGCMLVVADRGDRLVGFVQITDVHFAGRHGKLGMAIRPERRGQGYGRKALDLLLLHAASELALLKLLLEVRADNEVAIRLYERTGFRRVGAFHRHYDDGTKRHDVLLMERFLGPSAP
jgi:RimJ/RimL family protein N-acetyltransferase